MDVTTPPLWVLTDERGAGKTVHCGALAEQASIAGWDVAGLLSPGIFKDGVKTGILTQDLRTGESRPLAMLSRLNVKRSMFTLNLGSGSSIPPLWIGAIKSFNPACPVICSSSMNLVPSNSFAVARRVSV